MMGSVATLLRRERGTLMAVMGLRAAAAIVTGAVALLVSTGVDARDPGHERLAPVVDAHVHGTVGISADGLLEERFTVPREVRTELERLAPGASIRLQSWPVAPGDHRTIRVARRTVYAPDARLFEVKNDSIREVPRSPRIHYVGTIEDESGSGIVLVLDPRTGELGGVAATQGGGFELMPTESRDTMRVIATDERISPIDPTWDCGGERVELPDTPWNQAIVNSDRTTAKSGGMLEAVIAIDTDTELLSQKFGNSTAAAADYIADLLAAINVMYERDLGVTLLQGTTYLRVGSDPYTQNSGSSASPSELYEFRDYWKAHYQSVDRALAAMLSGKSPSSNSASGIAWVGGLCSSNSGYSFSKVFKADYLSGDAKIVGHEIGHNFGSPHTHCYSPPIDHCWNLEGGCYTGATSCPGGAGTVMSYCHLVGCGSTLNFHPTAISRILNNYVDPATGVCVFEATQGGDGIFDDGFESDNTSAWSATIP